MKKLAGVLFAITGIALATTPQGGLNLVPDQNIKAIENISPNITTQDQNLGTRQINISNPVSTGELVNYIKNNLSDTDIAQDQQIISQVVGTTGDVEKTYNVSCLYWDGDWCVVFKVEYFPWTKNQPLSYLSMNTIPFEKEFFETQRLCNSLLDEYLRQNPQIQNQKTNLEIWLGKIGDNYWGGWCKLYTLTTSFYIKDLSKVDSFRLEKTFFDDWEEIDINNQVVYVGPFPGEYLKIVKVGGIEAVEYAPGKFGACELSTNWRKYPNKEVKYALRQGWNNVNIKVEVSGGGEGYSLFIMNTYPDNVQCNYQYCQKCLTVQASTLKILSGVKGFTSSKNVLLNLNGVPVASFSVKGLSPSFSLKLTTAQGFITKPITSSQEFVSTVNSKLYSVEVYSTASEFLFPFEISIKPLGKRIF